MPPCSVPTISIPMQLRNILVTKETRELLSPVISDGLYGGLFSVTVFPLTDNALL